MNNDPLVMMRAKEQEAPAGEGPDRERARNHPGVALVSPGIVPRSGAQADPRQPAQDEADPGRRRRPPPSSRRSPL